MSNEQNKKNRVSCIEASAALLLDFSENLNPERVFSKALFLAKKCVRGDRIERDTSVKKKKKKVHGSNALKAPCKREACCGGLSARL